MPKLKILETRLRKIYVIPIGDVHVGEIGFNKRAQEKLTGYINWVKKTPNAFVFLMGDLLNTASRHSVSSPFQQNMSTNQQLDVIVKLLEPIKDRIIGAITGNHENRMIDDYGYDPTIAICDRLGITYFGYDAVVFFRMNCHGPKKTPRGTLAGYFHHCTGGGATLGGKLNRVDKLKDIVCNADFFVGGHSHALISGDGEVFSIDKTKARIDILRRVFIDAGSYIDYEGGYANMKQLAPSRMGSPRILLQVKRDGKDKVHSDIHVSI